MIIDDAKCHVTNAISHWEIRRIIYTAVFDAIDLGYFVAKLPALLQLITPVRVQSCHSNQIMKKTPKGGNLCLLRN